MQVWNHRPEGAIALAREWREQGVDARAVTDLDAAVHGADIVSCATLASARRWCAAGLRAGTHLDLIGSFTPQMRECDAACFARSRVFVDTEEALAKSGDVLGAVAEGAFEATRLQGTLAQLVRGERAGRREAGEITLFKGGGQRARRPRRCRTRGRRYARPMSHTPRTIRFWWKTSPPAACASSAPSR